MLFDSGALMGGLLMNIFLPFSHICIYIYMCTYIFSVTSCRKQIVFFFLHHCTQWLFESRTAVVDLGDFIHFMLKVWGFDVWSSVEALFCKYLNIFSMLFPTVSGVPVLYTVRRSKAYSPESSFGDMMQADSSASVVQAQSDTVNYFFCVYISSPRSPLWIWSITLSPQCQLLILWFFFFSSFW